MNPALADQDLGALLISSQCSPEFARCDFLLALQTGHAMQLWLHFLLSHLAAAGKDPRRAPWVFAERLLPRTEDTVAARFQERFPNIWERAF